MTPTGIFQLLVEVSEILAELETPWALVGGLAVSVYVEPRFTRDIDLAVSVADDREAEAFLHSWQRRGFLLETVVEQDAVGRMASVRTFPGGRQPGAVVDLLFASSGIEQELSQQAQILEVARGIMIPVARPGHLFALKLLAEDPELRPQDRIDINNLAEIIVGAERDAAREAVRLIEERGFARGRDLSSLLEREL